MASVVKWRHHFKLKNSDSFETAIDTGCTILLVWNEHWYVCIVITRGRWFDSCPRKWLQSMSEGSSTLASSGRCKPKIYINHLKVTLIIINWRSIEIKSCIWKCFWTALFSVSIFVLSKRWLFFTPEHHFDHVKIIMLVKHMDFSDFSLWWLLGDLFFLAFICLFFYISIGYDWLYNRRT